MQLATILGHQPDTGNAPQPVAAAPQQYFLKWHKSKQLLAAKIERYNSGRPLGEQLRSAHKKLLEYMLYLYSNELSKYQGYCAPLEEGKELPPLWTNNVQLSQEMGISERTAINLRKRIKASGLIKKEHWHGSNCSYEIEFDYSILHIQLKGQPDNQAWKFDPKFSSLLGADAPPNMQTLRHTISSTQSQGTSKLNKLSGVHSGEMPENTGFPPNTPVDNPQNPVKNAGEAVDNSSETPNTRIDSKPDTPQATSTGYEADRAEAGTFPPISAAAPTTMEEALAGIAGDLRKKIELHVSTIWSCAYDSLYSDKYLTDSVVDQAKAHLCTYFTAAPDPARWGAGAREIITRINLVSRWIRTGLEKGENRWVPIPSVYFDPKNERGFRATKPWYKKHKAIQAEIQCKVIVTKMVNKYRKSLEPGAAIGPAATHRKIVQYLGKKSQALVIEFNNQIATLCQQEQERK